MSGIWKRGLLALLGVGVSMLPKLVCPACWPAYAGLLSSVGLGFLVSTAYLLPLTIGFLALALGALAFHASERRGYGPFVLGVFAASGVVLGKFVWDSTVSIYSAVVLFILASLWNAWPHNVFNGRQRLRSRSVPALSSSENASICCGHKDAEAAIQMEKLGNLPTNRYDMSILCGYSLQSVRGGMDDDIFQRICAEHSAVYSRR